MWHIHRIENYLAIKVNELLMHATKWMNVGNTMLGERNQMQKSYIVQFYLHKMLRKGKSIEIEIRITAAHS